jgi:BNR-Asp box repeat
MSDTLLVGTRKGLATVHRHRDGWGVFGMEFLGVPVITTLIDERDGAWYASLNHGHFGVKIHRSDDRGKTWTEIATPIYPTKPEGLVEMEPMGRREIPWSTEQAWVLAAGHADEPGVLWCGTIPGGLFRSADRGETWSIVPSLWEHETRTQWFGGGYDLPGIHSIQVDPRCGGQRVVIAISCGGVWSTEDRGTTWAASTGMRAPFAPPDWAEIPHIQDPHCLAVCAADPDVAWVQHHSGMYRSTDAGRTFTEITEVAPSNFGFPVAAHPTDPLTAWFAPAIADECRVPVDGRMVVTRTRDGGQSFEQLGNGLPQKHAYDLIYRHGLDVDATGTRLALGSTTGSLWVTENAGDTFTAVSANLPPISSVRFV